MILALLFALPLEGENLLCFGAGIPSVLPGSPRTCTTVAASQAQHIGRKGQDRLHAYLLATPLPNIFRSSLAAQGGM